ncbi:DUF456 domain-containing protein [Micromonospora sp. NPDC049559]|uniref:DUF456 domain-containing protein n=1 Tax=Micromonospora sp. NPDC049559 TaxID=3155923 RepID=UPI003414E272
MELTDGQTAVTVLCAVAIVAGIVGVVVPVLPALPLCWLGVLVWAVFGGAGWGRWVVLAVVTLVVLAGTVVKYAWPGRNLKRSGVPNRTLLAGGALGLVGFFVIPVVGLPIGFVLGVWLAERVRLGDSRLAWPSTRQAVKATGLSMLVELAAALTVAAVWVLGLFLA